MQIGNYVQYKSELFIICEIIGDKAKILSPTIGKRFVNMVNLTMTNKRPAKQVNHRGTKYLVTAKELIISLATNKIMKWSNTNGYRLQIILKAGRGPVFLEEQAI